MFFASFFQTMVHPQISPGAASFMHHQQPQPQTVFATASATGTSPLASPVLRRPTVAPVYPPPPPPYPGQPPPSPQLSQTGAAHYAQSPHTPHVSPVGPGAWPPAHHDQVTAAAVAAAAAAGQQAPPHGEEQMLPMMPIPVQMAPPGSMQPGAPTQQPPHTAPATNISQSNNRRINLSKWAEDEKLGDKASTAAVLYSNTHHPDLQQKYPEFNDRAKQINKLWRKLCPEDRVQWVVSFEISSSQFVLFAVIIIFCVL